MVRHRRLAAATLALTAAIGVSGCDNRNDSNAPNATESTTSVETSADSTGPTTATSPTDGTPTTGSGTPTSSTVETASPTTHDNSPVRRAKRSQVPLADLPGFNTDWVWDRAAGRSGVRPESAATSQCMQASLTAIGGVVEYSTAYTVAGDTADEAVLTTVVFPDERTATTAESVLASWLAKCRAYVAKQPRVDQVAVTEDRTVTTSVGTGHHRLIGYGPVKGDPHSMYFNGEGYVRDGDVLSYLVMHSVGQDYNYEDDQEPVVLGLQAAADALKASR